MALKDIVFQIGDIDVTKEVTYKIPEGEYEVYFSEIEYKDYPEKDSGAYRLIFKTLDDTRTISKFIYINGQDNNHMQVGIHTLLNDLYKISGQKLKTNDVIMNPHSFVLDVEEEMKGLKAWVRVTNNKNNDYQTIKIISTFNENKGRQQSADDDLPF